MANSDSIVSWAQCSLEHGSFLHSHGTWQFLSHTMCPLGVSHSMSLAGVFLLFPLLLAVNGVIIGTSALLQVVISLHSRPYLICGFSNFGKKPSLDPELQLEWGVGVFPRAETFRG